MQTDCEGGAIAYCLQYAANFGQDYTKTKQRIQKTDVNKQPIFSNEDFQRLIQREEEDELHLTMTRTVIKPREGFKSRLHDKQILPSVKSNQKKLKQFDIPSPNRKSLQQPLRTESYHKSRDEMKSQIKDRAQEAFKRYEQMGKTWEKFGVFKQDIVNFRIQTLKEAKIQRLILDISEHELNKAENNEQREKENDVMTRLIKVITKPNSDNKEEVKKNYEFHEQRLKDMRNKTRHIQKAKF